MKNPKSILVVDDEAAMRKNISDLLSSEGYFIAEAEDGEEAIVRFMQESPMLVLLDINLPKIDGLTVLTQFRKFNPDIPVIIFTAYGTSDRAIEAMKGGAFDYLEKPFELDELLLTVNRALNYSTLIGEVKQLRTQITGSNLVLGEVQLIGRSSRMQEIFKLIGRIATTDATVLIQGESGTGKELIADALQKHSSRKDAPYIKVNCGALSESLLESEIFGHEKGAFTGAIAQKLGCFELANNGTIFLDEINNMPASLQIRLLRLLQNQSFYRVGGENEVKVDVRVIAATNKDIEQEVEKGYFRKDLFYRLNVIRFNLPALRERIEDIPYLIEHFLKKYSPVKEFIVSNETLEKLTSYPWPGNVRELENLIHSGVIMTRDNTLKIDNNYYDIKKRQEKPEDIYTNSLEIGLHKTIEKIEKECIINALKKTNGNRSEAANLLKIHRRLLYTKIKEYKISLYNETEK
jgi:two-component system, NtrC family, response regulator AtoC